MRAGFPNRDEEEFPRRTNTLNPCRSGALAERPVQAEHDERRVCGHPVLFFIHGADGHNPPANDSLSRFVPVLPFV